MLSSLVFSVTYRCPVACRYCGVNAGPHRRERLTLPQIRQLIDEVSDIGLTSVVVFTGGEPTLLGKDLYEAISYAAVKGFKTRVVSNAYWARSPERARAVIRRLQQAGLTEINFSCDDFHQEHIPLERVKWANDAARDLGMPCLLAVKGIRRATINIPYLEQYFGVKLSLFRKGAENPTNDVASFGTTVPVGWHSEELADNDLLYVEPERWHGGCTSVLESIVITPRAELAICCGIGADDYPEATVGSLYDKTLGELLTIANDDLIINWLALEGPASMMRFVSSVDSSIQFRERYTSMCHACHDLFTNPKARKILREQGHSMSAALSIKRAWLESHRAELCAKARQEDEEPGNARYENSGAQDPSR